MYICFLDMDGVLVTEQAFFYWLRREDCKRKKNDVRADRSCPIAISNLNYLCKNIPDLSVVISSTWRKYFSVEEMQSILEEDGFQYKERIIGKTPEEPRRLSDDQYSCRGTEILKWIEDAKDIEVKDWVALDDHANNISKEHLYQTEQEIGFTIIQAYSIIERFNPKWPRPIFMM